MFEDWLPEYHCECVICEFCLTRRKEQLRKTMDKKIKKLQKDTKKIVKEEASLLKEDKKHDKIIDKAKKKMKGKC